MKNISDNFSRKLAKMIIRVSMISWMSNIYQINDPKLVDIPLIFQEIVLWLMIKDLSRWENLPKISKSPLLGKGKSMYHGHIFEEPCANFWVNKLKIGTGLSTGWQARTPRWGGEREADRDLTKDKCVYLFKCSPLCQEVGMGLDGW